MDQEPEHSSPSPRQLTLDTSNIFHSNLDSCGLVAEAWRAEHDEVLWRFFGKRYRFDVVTSRIKIAFFLGIPFIGFVWLLAEIVIYPGLYVDFIRNEPLSLLIGLIVYALSLILVPYVVSYGVLPWAFRHVEAMFFYNRKDWFPSAPKTSRLAMVECECSIGETKISRLDLDDDGAGPESLSRRETVSLLLRCMLFLRASRKGVETDCPTCHGPGIIYVENLDSSSKKYVDNYQFVDLRLPHPLHFFPMVGKFGGDEGVDSIGGWERYERLIAPLRLARLNERDYLQHVSKQLSLQVCYADYLGEYSTHAEDLLQPLRTDRARGMKRTVLWLLGVLLATPLMLYFAPDLGFINNTWAPIVSGLAGLLMVDYFLFQIRSSKFRYLPQAHAYQKRYLMPLEGNKRIHIEECQACCPWTTHESSASLTRWNRSSYTDDFLDVERFPKVRYSYFRGAVISPVLGNTGCENCSGIGAIFSTIQFPHDYIEAGFFEPVEEE